MGRARGGHSRSPWGAGSRGAWGLLTDVPGGDPEGLDHHRLLPRLGDAVQDPALGGEFPKAPAIFISQDFQN